MFGRRAVFGSAHKKPAIEDNGCKILCFTLQLTMILSDAAGTHVLKAGVVLMFSILVLIRHSSFTETMCFPPDTFLQSLFFSFTKEASKYKQPGRSWPK